MAKPSYPATLNTSDALASGLLGFWLLNEGGTSTIAHDSTSTANNGTITSDVSWTTGDGSDLVLSFPASATANLNVIDLGSSSTYSPSAMTVVVRFQADSSFTGNWQQLFGRGSVYSGFTWTLVYNGSNIDLRSPGGNTATIAASKDVWHTVIGTFSGGGDQNRIYLDGVEGTPDPYGAVGTGTYNLAIGRGSSGFNNPDSYGGLISYAGIWNRVFSSTDRTDFLATPFRMFSGGGGGGPTAVANFVGGLGVPGQVPVNYTA